MPAQAGAGILDSSSRALLARGGGEGEGEGEGEELAVWVGALGATIVRSVTIVVIVGVTVVNIIQKGRGILGANKSPFYATALGGRSC